MRHLAAASNQSGELVGAAAMLRFDRLEQPRTPGSRILAQSTVVIGG
jgi:hypothetical protein